MKNYIKRKLPYLLIGGLLLGPSSCSEDFLEAEITGQLSDQVIANNAAGLEGMLLSTYSVLNGRGNGWMGGSSNWLWGSIRGGDANKGTNAGDFNTINPIERFEVATDLFNPNIDEKWRGMYEGISRANRLLTVLELSDEIPEAQKLRIKSEALFLRGHYYFELKRNFNMVPWIDESVDYGTGIETVTNQADIWANIEADFQFAYTNLPEGQAAIGRANKWAAAAYLGKVMVYQGKYAAAKDLLALVITQGKTPDGRPYGLVLHFADVFSGDNQNNEESIFAFQAASGTGDINNTNQDLAMNYPYNTGQAGPGECCGFFAPTFDLASSYRTANGLPLLDNSYRLPANELKSDMGVASSAAFTPDEGTVDPRLDHTIARRGIPFLDWGPHPGADWIRDQSYAGPYTQKKYSYRKVDRGVNQDGGSWTPGYHSINFIILRFSDILLLAAESEILGGGDPALALEYVNRVRRRAAASPLLTDDGTAPAANYSVAEYTAWGSTEAAMDAIKFERKLELALEGERFYDLVRWGIAAEALNPLLQYEAAKLPTHFGGPQAQFTAPRDNYLPIPQRQIELLGADVLIQNPGYAN